MSDSRPITDGVQIADPLSKAEGLAAVRLHRIGRRKRLMTKDDWRLICETIELVLWRAEQRHKQNKTMKKTTEAQTKRINAAFERMSAEMVKYLNTCYANGAPVKSVTVRTGNNGQPIKTSVRYQR